MKENKVKDGEKRLCLQNGSSVPNVSLKSNKINAEVEMCELPVPLVMCFSFPVGTMPLLLLIHLDCVA